MLGRLRRLVEELLIRQLGILAHQRIHLLLLRSSFFVSFDWTTFSSLPLVFFSGINGTSLLIGEASRIGGAAARRIRGDRRARIRRLRAALIVSATSPCLSARQP